MITAVNVVLLPPIAVKPGRRMIWVTAVHVTLPLTVTVPLVVIVFSAWQGVDAVTAPLMVRFVGITTAVVAEASAENALVPPALTALTL